MNYNREQTDEVIDLKDLCIYILRKWRLLLIAMLVGAVLLVTYRVFLNPNAVSLSTTEQKEIQSLIDANKKSISSYNASIQENNYKISENTKTIEADQVDLEIQKDLASKLESIINKYSSSGSQAIEALTDANIQLAAVKKKIYDYESEINALQQENENLPISNEDLQDKIDKLKDDNKSLSKSLSPQASKISIGSIIKYAVIGSLLGGFIVFGIVFLQCILYKKLRSAKELSERYKLNVFGSLYVLPKSEKHNKIDKVIDKLSGYSYTIDEKMQYMIISSAIQVMSSEKDEEIILTGTVDKEMIYNICDKLSEFLPKEKYKLSAVINPVYDPESLLKIKQHTVILLEAKDISDKREIDKLSGLLHAGKAEILGAVML